MGTRRDPLGISAWRSTAHRINMSSQAPVHSVLVQKSVTTITNLAGRLSVWMLGETCPGWKEGRHKKLAIRLPATLVRPGVPGFLLRRGHPIAASGQYRRG